jgi:hypothetical protein
MVLGRIWGYASLPTLDRCTRGWLKVFICKINGFDVTKEFALFYMKPCPMRWFV